MDTFTATMIAEGDYAAAGYDEQPDEDTILAAWQHLVDTGVCWQLQGWFGRTAMGLIRVGLIEEKQS